jgi:hypothetical protein
MGALKKTHYFNTDKNSSMMLIFREDISMFKDSIDIGKNMDKHR